MEGKNIRRMDESVSILMRMVYNMQYDRLVRYEKGFIPGKLRKLRTRHKTSLCAKDLTLCKENHSEFTVYSTASLEPHTYRATFRRHIKCTCLLVCEECKLCLHQVSCECFDHLIKGNFCKNIHFAALQDHSEHDSQSHLPTDMMNELSDSPFVAENEPEALLAEEKKLLRTTRGSTSQSLESEINAEVVRVTRILESCETPEEIKSLSKFIDAMQPTLNSLRLNTNREISSISGSQGAKRNIEQQRRFEKAKKRTQPKKQRASESSLKMELFKSKTIVSSEHDYNWKIELKFESEK